MVGCTAEVVDVQYNRLRRCRLITLDKGGTESKSEERTGEEELHFEASDLMIGKTRFRWRFSAALKVS